MKNGKPMEVNMPGKTGAFRFTLAVRSRTSAGVFRNDSILVKTLWNDSTMAAGTYTRYWDGTDDYGHTIDAPDSMYKVKVLSNNVKYEWQGTIGNSSDSMTGITKHRGYYKCMQGLAFASNGFGYFCNGYSEGLPSIAKFNVLKPNQKLFIGSTAKNNNANTDFVCTDNVNVYWGASAAGARNNSFVYATAISNDAPVNFPAAVSYTPPHGRAYQTIGYLNLPGSAISGLAVQKKGIFLFIARAGLNQLQVLNKNNGALIKTIELPSPSGLSVDKSDNLWMISKSVVSKYIVNADGSLISANIVVSGLLDPLSTAVSMDGSNLAVADGSSSQQVKIFNTATGTLTTTLGIEGGYYSDATVTNNKFYFNDINGNLQTFVAFQNDGSFWVNDPGNFRVQQYNKVGVFINRIMSMGASYNVWVDKNNINRIFSGLLEFSIDYRVQKLTGKAGWVLVKNWGALYSLTKYGKYGFVTPVTLSNGRTYALASRIKNNYEVLEFGANNQLRFTGILLNNSQRILCSDGALQAYTSTGAISVYKKFPLTGFDDSGNPVWNPTGEVLATAAANNTTGNPVTAPNSQIFSTTNKIALFNHHSWSNSNGPVFSTGYHLGIMEKGASNTFQWQTEKSTHRNYAGAYPQAGWYDCGNMVNDYGGGNVNIVGHYILTSYHGEFWKNGQTNRYNLYYDNGLAIGQFGTDRFENNFNIFAAPEMAGNALTPNLVDAGGDSLYLWHGDESDHSGIHRWKISGLNTISEQVIAVAYPSAYVSPMIDYIDLMSGLPFNDSLDNSFAGWTKIPVSNILSNQYTDYWAVLTNKQTYKKENIDVQVRAAVASPGTYSVTRSLGSKSVANSWKISGEIAFPPGTNANNQKSQQYLEIEDNNGKLLAIFYTTATEIKANNETIGKISSIQDLKNLKPFEISCTAGKISFRYDIFKSSANKLADPTANWRAPGNLRLRFVNTGQPGNILPQLISVKDLDSI